MDIARPELKRQKRRRQILWGSIAIVVLIGVTVGISRLKPAAPTVDRSTIWTDSVKRGSMLRQVRGLGTLIPVMRMSVRFPPRLKPPLSESSNFPDR
jgi:HlyD family secretion protein